MWACCPIATHPSGWIVIAQHVPPSGGYVCSSAPVTGTVHLYADTLCTNASLTMSHMCYYTGTPLFHSGNIPNTRLHIARHRQTTPLYSRRVYPLTRGGRSFHYVTCRRTPYQGAPHQDQTGRLLPGVSTPVFRPANPYRSRPPSGVQPRPPYPGVWGEPPDCCGAVLRRTARWR